MAIYVNKAIVPLVLNAGSATYYFPARGYVPVNATTTAELAAAAARGELTEEQNTYPSIHLDASLATRTPLQDAVSLASVSAAVADAATVTDHLHADFLASHYEGNSRLRVYPRTTANSLQVITGAANTFGAWTVAIPVATVGMNYNVSGFIVEGAALAAGTYMLQFAKAVAPTNPELLGEFRFRAGGLAGIIPPAPYKLQQDHLHSGEGVWVRAMDTGGAVTISYSLQLYQHYELTDAHTEENVHWPWANC